MKVFTPPQPVGYITPEQFGAKGDGVTNDYTALTATIAAALALGGTAMIRLSANKKYLTSKYLYFLGARGLTIIGSNNSEIIYPSADTSVLADSIATTINAARSAFFFDRCRDCVITDVVFRGQNIQAIHENVGLAFYLSSCSGFTINNPTIINGGALIQQDVVTNLSGTGDSITVSANATSGSSTSVGVNTLTNSGATMTSQQYVGYFLTDSAGIIWEIVANTATVFTVAANDLTPTAGAYTVNQKLVTLLDSANVFHNAMVRMRIHVTGWTSNQNNGAYPIVAYNSAGSISYINPTAVTDTGPATPARWEVTDGDRGTKINGGRSRNVRHACVPGTDTTIDGHRWEWDSSLADMCGIGDSFAVSGTGTGNVTLTDSSGRFRAHQAKRYISIADSTTSANNGTFLIETVASNGSSLTYTNASAVPEPFPGEWWIPGGEKGGLGVGTAGITHISGDTYQLEVATASFSQADQYKMLTICKATTQANNIASLITSVVSSTKVQYTNTRGAATAEDYSGIWLIDGYEYGIIGNVDTYGSTHALYIFGGRSGIKILNSYFGYNRSCCVKVSGSSAAVFDIQVLGCTFVECNSVAIFGADDVNPHSGFIFANNTIVDCGTGRWSNDNVFTIMGSRGVEITNNWIYVTHNAIGSVNGTTVAGRYILHAARYADGLDNNGTSQALEDIFFCDNHIKTVGKSVSLNAGAVYIGGVYIRGCGLRGKFRRGGTALTRATAVVPTLVTNATDTFTKTGHGYTSGDGPIRVSSSGSIPAGLTGGTDYYAIKITTSTFKVATSFANAQAGTPVDITTDGAGTISWTSDLMTFNDNSAYFSSDDVGKLITFVNAADSGNNGSFQITSVTSKTVLKFHNVSGVTTSTSGNMGTYRIPGTNKITNCVVARNDFAGVCTVGVTMQVNVGPEVYNNIFSNYNSTIRFAGDNAPRAYGNRRNGTGTQTPTMRVDSGTSWPIIYDNIETNVGLGASGGRGCEISIDASVTAQDHPLLGKKVRFRPTGGFEEIVIPYGDFFVDGDRFWIDVSPFSFATPFTYKATITDATTQFNSMASLMALINLVGGAGTTYNATDYGATLTGAPVSSHIWIRKVVATAAATPETGTFGVKSDCLFPTALPFLRNDGVANTSCRSRGGGSTGPVADRSVIWSQYAGFAGGAQIWADNEAAKSMLNGYRQATATITCTTKANYLDTDYMTIPDGINVAKVYEFDTAGDGVTAGRIQVNISGATTAADVATILRTAILANQPAIAVVNAGSGVLNLTHNWPGVGANNTITENVVNAGHTVSGFTGGTTAGYRPLKNILDAGCNENIIHGTSLGTEELRAVL